MACIATWSFGLQAVNDAFINIKQGVECVDVVQHAVNVVEDDPSTGRYYVGRGCYPNGEGIVQLDAAIMRGKDGSFGSVAALERYAKPISVAKCLLDDPSLCMLVGRGATKFAEERGFSLEDNDALMTKETKEAYENFKTKNAVPHRTGHDTLAVLARDVNGHIAAGVSTSGPPFKPCGRVGDSPLPGCGLFADDGAGAAAATGDGEQIMKFCPSFKIVQLMKEGRSPQQACEDVVTEMKRQSSRSFEVGLIALDTKGNGGAATTVKEWLDFRDGITYNSFPYSYWKDGLEKPTIITRPAL